MKNSSKGTLPRRGFALTEVMVGIGIFGILTAAMLSLMKLTMDGMKRTQQMADRSGLNAELTATFANPIRCGKIFKNAAGNPAQFGPPANATTLILEPGGTDLTQIDLGGTRVMKVGEVYQGLFIDSIELNELDFSKRTGYASGGLFSNYYYASLTIKTSKLSVNPGDAPTPNPDMEFRMFLKVPGAGADQNKIIGCNSALGSLWNDDGLGNIYRQGGKVTIGLSPPSTSPPQPVPGFGDFNVGRAFAITVNTSANAGADDNLAAGINALTRVTTGNRNVAYGSNSLRNNLTGNDNTAVGMDSLGNTSSGSSNVGVGVGSLAQNSTGARNVAVGYLSMSNNSSGSNNTAVGTYALANNAAGVGNTAIGFFSMQSPGLTGNDNTAVGLNTLFGFQRGTMNVALGQQAMADTIEGSHNVGVGFEAVRAFSAVAPSAWANVGVGSMAVRCRWGSTCTGNGNIGIGYQANVYLEGAGSNNTAIGHLSGVLPGSGTISKTIAIGAETRVGAANAIAIGTGTSPTQTMATGQYAIAIGSGTGILPSDLTAATATNAIAIGTNAIASAANAIQIGSGTNNVANSIQFAYPINITGGINANGALSGTSLSVTGAANSASISTGAISASSINASSVSATGNISAGGTFYAPLATKAASGFNLQWDATNEISIIASDERLKKDIEPLSDALVKVLKLRGVSYRAKANSSDGEKSLGFIAQEVEKIIPELVGTMPDKMGTKVVDYQAMTAVLVEAIKDQQKLIDQQKLSIEAQGEELSQIKKFLCSSHPQSGFCKQAN